MPSTAPNWYPIFAQTLRILNTNSIHFLTISLLFLPLILSISIAIISSGSISLTSLLTVSVAVAVVIPAVAGIASITYSTHHSIIKKQNLTFITTFNSLSHSFIPLLSTFIAGIIKLFIIITAVTEFIKSVGLGFQFDVSLLTNVVTVVTILFLIVVWGYAAPVSVLESKSGFVSLAKSENQSFEYKFISFFIMIIAGFMINSFFLHLSVIHKQSEVTWNQIVQIGVSFVQFLLYILVYVVANTVLYVCCKIASGEEEVEAGKTEGEKPFMMLGGFTYIMLLGNIVRGITLSIG